MGIQEICHTSRDAKVLTLAQPENMCGMECRCGTALPAQVVGREAAGQDTSGLTCVAVDTVAHSADVAKDNVGVTW